ncbi:AAA family ATPase [Mesorhizobium sp. 128a]
MSLAEKHRPDRFSKVVGQPKVIRYLSAVVLSSSEPKHLLLCGSHASGKTTLAKIYAKALNCSNVDSEGSPCNECVFCTHPEQYLFEYDVPGQGGEKADIAAWLEGRDQTPVDHRTTVFFFDEAHALSWEADDSLLKRIENAPKGVAFVFATTEPSRLKVALRSRLARLEVRALPVDDAVSLLRSVADHERIEYDVDGLALLAVIKRGYPRDLLIALEQVRGLGNSVTPVTVKEIFGLEQTAWLVQLFSAFASGDEARQHEVLSGWHDEIRVKIDWIRVFLTAILYRDIHGLDVVIDPVTYAVKDSGAAIVDGFCRRLGLSSVQQVLPFWERLLSFWDRPVSNDQVELQLRMALFQDLVNRRLTEVSTGTAAQSSHPSSLEHENGSNVDSSLRRDRRRDHTDADLLQLVPADQALGDRQSLSLMDVREIINRASWFTQSTGCRVNAAFEIWQSSAGIERDITVKFIENFISDLWPGSSDLPRMTASIVVLEAGDFDMLTGYICAHIEGLDDSHARSRLLDWCGRFGEGHPNGSAHGIDVNLPEDHAGMKFHWKEVLNLCAGLGGDAFVGGDQAEELLQAIGVKENEWREPVGLPFPVLHFHGLMANAAIDEAKAYGMEFLSAFDDQAWPQLRREWELKEYKDRIKERDYRRQQQAELRIFDADPQRLKAERERLQAGWPEAKRRRRSWKIWWRALP